MVMRKSFTRLRAILIQTEFQEESIKGISEQLIRKVTIT
jgi:hypothetical protein